jgi:hypothetical protein
MVKPFTFAHSKTVRNFFKPAPALQADRGGLAKSHGMNPKVHALADRLVKKGKVKMSIIGPPCANCCIESSAC